MSEWVAAGGARDGRDFAFFRRSCGVCAFAALLWPLGASAQTPQVLPEIQVISTSPLPGAGIDREKVPALVQTITSEDFARAYSPNITDTLFQRIPGVSTSDQQGNSFQSDIRYRGFVASPVPGQPQGIAVYMGGIRLNEAFGDTVNFDFIPTNAIDRADIQSNNPVFGLNALGGALSLQMKNGFTFHGSEIEFQAGSYGRLHGGVQVGIQRDDIALYVAAQGLDERGWRQQSPAQFARVYADIGWRHDGNELHLVLSGASNYFGVVAAAPIELLQRDWSSIYTWPQTTLNQTALAALNGKFTVADNWTLQSNVYVRSFRQSHVDGNGADVERCSNASSFPEQAVPGRRRLPASESGDDSVSQSVRRARSEQQPDPLPSRRRQHLCWGAVRHDRPHQHGYQLHRRLAAGDERSEGLRSRQPLHDRRQPRSQPHRLHILEYARLHQPGPVDRGQPGDPRQRTDHPHARQHRLHPGQPRGSEHLLRALRDRYVRRHGTTRRDARADASTSRGSRWRTAPAPRRTSTRI